MIAAKVVNNSSFGKENFIFLQKNNSMTEAVISRIVMPGMLNDRGILFGGQLLSWMDEAAYIAVLRFLKRPVVTYSADKIKFLHPVKSGEIVKICCKVSKATSIRVQVLVEVFSERLTDGLPEKVATACFYLCPVDENNKPVINMN